MRVKPRETQTRSHQSVARRAAITRSLKTNSAAKPLWRAAVRTVDAAPDQARRRAMGKYVYCIIRATERMAYGPIGLGADPPEV